MNDEQLLAFIRQVRPDMETYFKGQLSPGGDDASMLQWAKAHLAAVPQDRAQFEQFAGVPSQPVTPQAPAAPAPTSNPQLDTLLSELRLDPDFAAFPQEWQNDIAQQIQSGGLEGTAQANLAWAQQNPNDPGAAALIRWANKANENAPLVNPETVPLEQDLLDRFLPRLYEDIEGDAERRALADRLRALAEGDFDNARNLLSPEENARRLAEENAQADATGTRLSESAATSAAEQLAALQAAIAAMGENLTGELAARAAALEAQLASLSANLDSLDETQRKALSDQIAANLANLDESVNAQRGALATEIEALRGAADTQSQARLAALETELASLTEAQTPVSQARLQGAEALVTGINLGLEQTRDALTAQQAKRGYLGGSSYDDANLATATIGARQDAARALAGAQELNALDTRSISTRGATERRSIADELARAAAGITERGAGGERSLADSLAQGRRGINDAGAAGVAGITNSTANARYGIRNTGANQMFQDQVFGAGQRRSLADSLAQGGATIAGNRATQQQTARDNTTIARQNYFDNAYTRGLTSALARPALSTNLASTIRGLDDYANSGLARSLGTLNWWSTNTGAPPTPNYTPVQPSGSGNDLAGLGAGLVGAGFNIWQQNQANKASSIPSVWSGFNNLDFNNSGAVNAN